MVSESEKQTEQKTKERIREKKTPAPSGDPPDAIKQRERETKARQLALAKQVKKLLTPAAVAGVVVAVAAPEESVAALAAEVGAKYRVPQLLNEATRVVLQAEHAALHAVVEAEHAALHAVVEAEHAALHAVVEAEHAAVHAAVEAAVEAEHAAVQEAVEVYNEVVSAVKKLQH
jgi:hypothetical protein